MPAVINLVDQRFGRLVVIGRDGSRNGYATWRARCDCGTETTVRSNKLRLGHTKSCGCLRVETTRALRQQDVVDYAGAHSRVKAARGPASNHPCVDCGDPAQDWSYDRLDPNELRGQNAYGRGCAYSLDTNHYHPRCKPCHASFDAPTRKAN